MMKPMDTQRLVEEAAGDVDRSLLEGTGSGGILSAGYFADGPLVNRLREGEGVDYALQNLTRGLTIKRDDQTDKVEPASHLRSVLLVTDERLLYVVGQDEGDETFSVPLSRVQDINTSTGILKDRITVYTDSKTYDMYVRKGAGVEEVGEHVISATETVHSDRRTEYNEESDSKTAARDEEKTEKEEDTDLGSEARETTAESDPGSSEKPDHESLADSKPSEKARIDSPDSGDEFLWTGSDNVELPPKGDIEPSPGEGAGETDREIGPTSIASETNTDEPVASDGTNESDVNVTAESHTTVDVLVSDDDRQPVADARVTVVGTAFEAGGRTTQTGRWCLELPPGVGTVTIVVEHDEHGSVRENIPRVDGAVVDVTFAGMGEDETETTAEQEAVEYANDDEPGATPSREELIAELVALDEESSRKATRGRMRSEREYRPEDYEAEFGTWSAAVEAAMLDEEDEDASSTSQRQEAYTKGEILNAIREVAETVGGRPTSAEMQKHGRMSVGPAYRFFGSWGDAVSTALGDDDTAVEDGVAADSVDGAASRIAEADAAADQDREEDADVDEETDTDTDEAVVPEPESTDKDPLADGLEAAPTGRLSDVVVEIREVHDVTVEKRAAEYEVKTAAADPVELVVWEKHNLDLDAEPGTRLCLDDIRLTRWETDAGLSHQLDSTADLDVSVIAEGESVDDASEGSVPGEKSAVERFVGVGGATEGDAEALVDAGYTTVEDLESASIEELRSITDLNDGTALRIKAEFG